MSFEEIRKSLEEAIEISLETENCSEIEKVWVSLCESTNKDMVTHLDESFRSYVLKLIDAPHRNFDSLETLISLNIECCRRRLSSLQLPSILLLDTFSMLTTDEYPTMFFYVENITHMLSLEMFYESSKNNLLRMCNELLGKLPVHGEFKLRSRILVFLAEFFPLAERSGSNMQGHYNVGNVTNVAEITNLSDLESDEEDDNVANVDVELYNGVWALQDFFREPPRCYNEWNDFIKLSSYVLTSFDTIKVDPYITRIHNKDIKYVPKYCPEPKFFNFQLHDHRFRRFILVQVLIILQYLETSKFELTIDQTEWITDKRLDVFNLLSESLPNGSDFTLSIRKMFQSEEQWIQWKQNGCKEIVIPNLFNINSPSKIEKSTIGDIMKEANDKGLFYMGNPDLTDLWNLEPDNLKACKAVSRKFLPTLDQFYKDTMKESSSLFKEDGIRWMGLRLLSRENPQFFSIRHKMDLDSIFDFALDCISQRTEEIDQSQQLDEDYLIDFKITKITKRQFDRLCLELSDHWESIAIKLGCDGTAIQLVQRLHTNFLKSQAIIQSWFEECDESSLEHFIKILEDLHLENVASFLQNVIAENKCFTLT